MTILSEKGCRQSNKDQVWLPEALARVGLGRRLAASQGAGDEGHGPSVRPTDQAIDVEEDLRKGKTSW